MLCSGVIIVVMLVVLGGAAIWWSGGDLPELKQEIGAFQIVGHTTVAPTCMPLVSCSQQFADVPLPRYYVVWVVTQRSTTLSATRILTLPLQAPLDAPNLTR